MRKEKDGLCGLHALCALQWGRNLTVAEGGVQSTACLLLYWLQWGRNLTVAEGGDESELIPYAQWGFNGAAT